ncbi:hypothetical protein M0R45_027358 [Rubus argutus]|uniref:NAC domain-containing protein n=1 Tax=Rubus argutus TaxID=59490 RepID=A0AAW1X1L0_RUBAR
MASSSSSSIQFMTLEELDEGVVKTFQPTDAQLVGCYLYNKIFMAPTPIGLKSTFPEIDIYGSKGLPPWEIWRIYQPFKFPHQDFIYFFSPVKKLNPNGGSRFARTIGSDGGSWSETEAAKPVYVNGIQQPFGKLRKFRYEKNKDKSFEHHTAWLMDEFTINQASHLALCRLKINDKGGVRNKRKKFSDEENDRKTKSFKNRKIEPKRDQMQYNICEQQKGSASFTSTSTSTTTQQLSSPSQYEDDKAVQVQVHHDDNHDIWKDDQPIASIDQWYDERRQQQQFSDYSLEQLQELEHNKRCEEEEQLQQQDEQHLLPSASHYHEQQPQLLGDDVLMVSYQPRAPHYDDDQVVRVQEDSYNCYEQQLLLCDDHDYLDDENLMFSTPSLFGSDEMLNDDPNLMEASVAQPLASGDEEQQKFSDDYSLVLQQQVEPYKRCEEQQQEQDERLLQPSPSHFHDLGDDDPMIYGHQDFDIPLDTAYLQSDEFNGFYIDQDQPTALQWLDGDDQHQYSDILW